MIASLSFGSYFGTIGADRAVAAVAPGTPSGRASGPQQEQIAAIKGIARDAMKQYDLKSIIMRVTSGGKNVYTEALGESMTGVPATPAMHFRNGAMAFTYMATLLMELVDQKKVGLDDKLGKFLPNLPDADRITLKNLANMTSGYADYVNQPEVLRGTNLDPFRQWTPEELIRIGTSKPMMFEPGSNWGYSHTKPRHPGSSSRKDHWDALGQGDAEVHLRLIRGKSLLQDGSIPFFG